jgi:hypothetical protein
LTESMTSQEYEPCEAKAVYECTSLNESNCVSTAILKVRVQ